MASWEAEPAVGSGMDCCPHLSGVCTSVVRHEPCPDVHLKAMAKQVYQYTVGDTGKERLFSHFNMTRKERVTLWRQG